MKQHSNSNQNDMSICVKRSVPRNAKKIPGKSVDGSGFWGIIMLAIVFYLFIYLKTGVFIYRKEHVNLQGLAIGGVLGLILSLFIHNLLHVLALLGDEKPKLGFSLNPSKSSCVVGVIYGLNSPVDRNKVVLSTIMPTLFLGLLPLIGFLIIKNLFISSILLMFGGINLALCIWDWNKLRKIMKYTSKEDKVLVTGNEIYYIER